MLSPSSAHGGACGCSSFRDAGLAGPIITIPAYNIKGGVTAVSLGFGFLNRGRLSAAQISELRSSGSHGDDNYGSLAQTLALTHGVTDKVSLSLVVPFVESLDFREVHDGDLEQQGHSIGFGDITLMSKYNFYHRPKFQSALLAGIKFPTGATRVIADNNERFEATSQPGSGSFDPIFGIAFSKQLKTVGLDANFLYRISTPGAQNTVVGDVANYNIAVSYALNHGHEDEFHHHHHEHEDHSRHSVVHRTLERIFPEHIAGKHLTWDLIMEANTIWQESPEQSGITIPNHGGTTVYLSPGLRMVMDDNWVYNLSLGFPVIQALDGTQGGTDLQLAFNMATSF